MSRTLIRRGKPNEPAMAPTRPRYRTQPRDEAQARDGRTDLICGSCDVVIAFAIRRERVPADADFYLEAHHPFCRSCA